MNGALQISFVQSVLTAVAACVLSLTIKVAATVADTEQGRASQAFEVEGLQIWTMTPDVLILFGQSIKNIEIKRHCHCNIVWNKSFGRELIMQTCWKACITSWKINLYPVQRATLH